MASEGYAVGDRGTTQRIDPLALKPVAPQVSVLRIPLQQPLPVILGPPGHPRLTSAIGTVGYLPALTFLLVFAAWLYRQERPLWRTIALAAGLFAVSLIFRTLDAAVCSLVTLGTHVLWHLLNALVLFLLLDSLRQRGRYASVAR